MVYKNIVYILWLDIYGISMRYLWFLDGQKHWKFHQEMGGVYKPPSYLGLTNIH